MNDLKNYYESLVAKFIQTSDLKEMSLVMDEVAAGLADDEINGWLWEEVIQLGRETLNPEKRREMGISIFELLAEPPVHPIWMNSLSRLLSDKQLQWIVFEAYRNSPEKLYSDLVALAELPTEGVASPLSD